MKLFKTILISILGLFIPIVASAAIFNSAQVGSSPVNGYYLKTDGNTSTWAPVVGGGSGGGSWSTTTSTVSGQLVNYPNNATDIINVGSNSTTTGKFWIDPNTSKGFMNGSFVVGSRMPTYADDNLSTLDVVVDVPTYSFLGLQNVNTGTTASMDLVFANNKTTITDYYADCGISGGNNADPVFTGIGGASAYYCFNTDGAVSLGIGTTTAGSDFNWTVSHDGGNSYLINDIKMKLTNAGRLGIGTTTPMALLNVAGTTSPQFVIGSDGITESNWGFRNAGGYMFINPINPVTLATSTNPSITMSPTLNQVAIGTSTLAAGVQLTIGAGANPVATLFDSTSATGMYTIYRNSNIDFGYIGSAGVLFSGSAGSKTDLAIRASQNLTFGSGSGEDMRISTTGLVGIATSSPYKPLSVVGPGGVVAENYLATSTTATSTLSGITLLGFPTENAITSTFANAQVLIRNNSARTNALNIVNDTGATSILSLSNAGLLTINGAFSLNGNITCNTNCAMGNNTTTAGSNSTIRGSGAVDGSVILLSTSGVGTSDSIIFRTGDNGNRRSLFVDTNGNMTVGTSSPLTNETAQFTIVATSTATRLNLFEARTPNLGVATTSVFTITGTGVQLASSTPPTLSTCGTSPTITGNNNYGAVTTGGSASACTVTFANGGFPTFASCVITNQSMSVVNAMTYTVSATAFTVSQTGLGGSVINYRCDGY